MMNQITKLIIYLLLTTPLISLAGEDKIEGTLLNVSATEFIEVPEDLLVANLHYEFEATTAKEVQNQINVLMAKALEKAKLLKDVKVSTQQYSVYKYEFVLNKNDERKTKWRGSQGVIISGKSTDDILKLTGQLQEIGLVVDGLSYTISNDTREEVRDSLMELAVEKLMKKSKRVAKALGRDEIKVVTINVDADTSKPYPVMQYAMRMEAMAKNDMASPVAEPGQTQISMTVSATIMIKD
jgi:predicted secreted protein